MAQPGKVALFGANGAIGYPVAVELARREIPFRAVGRRKAILEEKFGKFTNAEICEADLSTTAGASAAAEGVDTIVYTVGLPYPLHAQHPVLMQTTLDAAIAAQVSRLVVISNVYSYGVPRTARVSEDHPRVPVAKKGEYRKDQEDRVLAAHEKGLVQGLILRLPDFYGPGADQSLANPIFQAALAGKTANWIGPVNTPHEFVFVPDTGPVILDLACCDDCYGQAWNFAGPAEINTLDFITRVYRAAGRAPKYRTAGRGLLKIMGWFSPLFRELPEMLYLQETPVILDDRKLMSRFPNVRKTSYEEGIRLTLEWMKGKPNRG